MRLKLAVSTAIALLIATGATRGWADKGKGTKHGSEVGSDSTINKQFEWENRVVGPKEGLDKDRLAAIQEKGRRDEEARKKEPPKKTQRAAGISEAGSASLPTMDIEQPAAAKKPAAKKVAATEQPRKKDALDSLLTEQGVKPYNPPGRSATASNDGLDSVFGSSDGAGSSGSKKTAGKKSTRRR